MTYVSLEILAWVLLACVLVIVAIQSSSVAFFVRLFFRFRRPHVSDDALPPAAIVLSIRGPDPYLADTIRALLEQNYPEFLIAIMLDDERDPALEIVESVIGETSARNVRISVLRNRLNTCSLKCSSLIQAIEDLDPQYEVVAFVDGDARPYSNWLRDLIVPLADPKVAVATGNRWYMPEVGNWGSLVRYFWNAGAVVQVWFNGIVWAGSMAMRRECIERIELLPAWSRALSVDATVYEQVRKHGLRVRFTPSVIMINPEHISLPTFRGWVRRQLVAARFCSNGWLIVVLHGLYLASLQVLGACLVVAAAWQRNWTACLIALAALGTYLVASMICVGFIELGVRRIARINGQSPHWLSVATLAKFFPAMILTHFAYAADLIWACFCRRVSWRGVDYEILSKTNVRMVSYQPYSEITSAGSASSVV